MAKLVFIKKTPAHLLNYGFDDYGAPFFIVDADRGRLSNSRHVARPNLNFAIGLDWSYCFCNNYSVDLSAKWEYNHYFDQNFFSDAFFLQKLNGDLSLHGLVVAQTSSF